MNKQQVIDNEHTYVLQTYNRPDIVFTHGEGALLYDSDGKQYLDFNAGIAVNALGYADPEWVAAVSAQAQKMGHVSNLYHSEPQATLAKKLVEHSFADRVYFCNSGAEANEAAIKFARKVASMRNEQLAMSKEEGDTAPVPPKYKIVSFSGGFHGRTMGALATTHKEKYRKPFEPLMGGVVFAEYNDVESAEAAIDAETCAVIVEPLQGEGGINPARGEFVRALRKLCDQHDALLIFDEVQCGLGRTGYLWAHEMFGVTPDIMTLAKPLAGGLPIGATLVTQKVAGAIEPGDHGSTFGANPIACAAANVVFDRVSNPDFLAEVRAKGEHLNQKLHDTLPADQIVEIRGVGLMVGIEMKSAVKPLVEKCVENGVLIISAGENVLRMIPPLIVSEEDIDVAVETAAQVMREGS